MIEVLAFINDQVKLHYSFCFTYNFRSDGAHPSALLQITWMNFHDSELKQPDKTISSEPRWAHF